MAPTEPAVRESVQQENRWIIGVAALDVMEFDALRRVKVN